MNKYQQWMKNIPFPEGFCLGATLMMEQAFPELKRVKGIYIEPDGKRNTHWFLLTDNNDVIDPTAHQFKRRGIYET